MQRKYIYTESDNNNYPLSLYADLDDRMINEVKKNKSIHYKSNSFVTGKEDAANNYFKAYYTRKEMCDIALNQVRKQVESIDRLDQFIVTCALSGGTGSGFTTFVLERLSVEYNLKVEKNAFFIYPSQRMSNNIVDVYNAVLTTNMTLEHCNSVVMFDNQSMYSVIDLQIGLDFVDYTHFNNLVSKIISIYTGLRRFSKINNTKLFSGLCPYPRLHYIIPQQEPLASIDDQINQEFNEKSLITYVIKPEQRLLQCEIKPTHICASFVHRSKYMNPFFGQYNLTLEKIRTIHQETPNIFKCQSENYAVIPGLAQLRQTDIFFSNDASVCNYFDNLGKNMKSSMQKEPLFIGLVEKDVNQKCIHVEKIFLPFVKTMRKDAIKEDQQKMKKLNEVNNQLILIIFFKPYYIQKAEILEFEYIFQKISCQFLLIKFQNQDIILDQIDCSQNTINYDIISFIGILNLLFK
ncbi:unnamed protein product [Paramecium sonneborni]|uniref:Tubulin/FtsZ GTPase domain-containing protein n=1 Tax=Paramecium sonneborni TaxID=65129 RepID=A0A8S1RKX2_9CILI|nr:unnamed protein product [Paramecium sonneborni]